MGGLKTVGMIILDMIIHLDMYVYISKVLHSFNKF